MVQEEKVICCSALWACMDGPLKGMMTTLGSNLYAETDRKSCDILEVMDK